jgi:hypothetical protein
MAKDAKQVFVPFSECRILFLHNNADVIVFSVKNSLCAALGVKAARIGSLAHGGVVTTYLPLNSREPQVFPASSWYQHMAPTINISDKKLLPHKVTTVPGCSGAPLFNLQGAVVALHAFGAESCHRESIDSEGRKTVVTDLKFGTSLKILRQIVDHKR